LIIYPYDVYLIGDDSFTDFKAYYFTNFSNETIIFDTLTSGMTNFSIRIYNKTNNLIITRSKNINATKYQHLIFSNGKNITVFNNTISYDSILIDGSYVDIHLDLTDEIYYGSYLNFSVGSYKYEGLIRAR